MSDGMQRFAQARPGLAFASGAAVGVLGGLIGLGGAEFRLPLLIGLFALAAHQAVRFNLLVSFVTVSASVAARFGFAAFPDLAALLPGDRRPHGRSRRRGVVPAGRIPATSAAKLVRKGHA